MKRKADDLDERETRLSQLLFKKNKDFTEKLKNYDEDTKFNKQPAWIDEDDESDRLPNETKSNSLFYTERLKQKYETLMGTPNWAKLGTKPEIENEDDATLRTVGHIQKKIPSLTLPKDFIQLKNPLKINESTGFDGPIRCIEFHPKVSVTMVGGDTGRITLFSIGGDECKKLHSYKLNYTRKVGITASFFTPDGSKAYTASKDSHSYCIYDLVKAKPQRVQLPTIVKKPDIFHLSPNGKYLAVSNGFEEIFIICGNSSELLKTIKSNSNISSVAFSHNSEQLYSYGNQGEISVWDMSTYRPIKKFLDQGCVTASCISASPCGRLLATGSGEGIVNVYETAKLTNSEPTPLKTISNLRTKVTNIRFNPTTEIMAASSAVYPLAVKLVHIPSYHIFTNFPKPPPNLHEVNTVSFSPNSGFMGLGNSKGCAYLYRLKHYENY